MSLRFFFPSLSQKTYTCKSGGAPHDPLASLVFCHPSQVDLSVINGRVRVQGQTLLDVDLPALIRRHNAIAYDLVRRELH